MRIFASVKRGAVILLFILSLLGGIGTQRPVLPDGGPAEPDARLESTTARDHAAALSLRKDFCLTAAQGWSFSGTESGNTLSVRTTQTCRRTSPSTRSLTRLVRTGKLIDTHNFHPFLSCLFLRETGSCSPDRYIFSLCCLRR